MTDELNSVLMLNEIIELNFIFSVNNTKIIVPEACFIQIYVMMKISWFELIFMSIGKMVK